MKARYKHIHQIINSQGFSLVEIMVAMAIMGIVSLGVVNLTNVGSTQNKTLRQNHIIDAAMGKINRSLSQADRCSGLGPLITTNEIRNIVGALEGDVTIENVIQQTEPLNPLALPLVASETRLVKVQLVITFRKSLPGGREADLNKISYARYVYENPVDPVAPGVGLGVRYAGCANFESDSLRAAFEANCRTVGGTFRVSGTNARVDPWSGDPNPLGRSYWCDLSTINGNNYFADKVKKEACEVLYGGAGSYNDGAVDQCRDMIVNGTMTGANVAPDRIGFEDAPGVYKFRTTFDQNACNIPPTATETSFVSGINVDGSVNCQTVGWCVIGTAGCGAWPEGSSVDHCTTDCSCANLIQADTSENDFGDADGDGGVNTCRPALSGLCSTLGTEEDTGQYDEGAGTDYLTYTCYGLDCDFKDYFEVTSGNVATDNQYDRSLSIGLYSTPDLVSANQATTCQTPVLSSSVTAGVCAIFDATSIANLANYPEGNDTVPDASGLDLSLVSGKSYGTNKDYCNGSVGVCREGGSGPSGTGGSSSEGNCCSLQFNNQPGSGDQCGNPMEDSCGNTYNNELGVVDQRWSTQCTSTGADGSANFCEINGSAEGNSGYTETSPATANCCENNYSCGTNPGSYASCSAAGSTFNYCSDASLTCSRESSAGRCCKSSYSCAESPNSECTGFHGASHDICGGSTPQCLGTGSTATCVECINNTHCAANEHCSSNSCVPDTCVQGTEIDTDTNACTPTNAVAGCDTGDGEGVDADSGSQSRTRTCNAEGSGFGPFGSFSTCSGGTCSCLASPLDPSTIACGTTDSNCAGTVTGTQCSAGFSCNSGSCDPIAGYCTSDADCGVSEICDPGNSCFTTSCSAANKPAISPFGCTTDFQCCEAGWQCDNTTCDAPGTIGN